MNADELMGNKEALICVYRRPETGFSASCYGTTYLNCLNVRFSNV
jgi:hypothetical protein